MIKGEVNFMENNEQQNEQVQKDEGYVERPAWQLWGARIGLVIFIAFVILQIVEIYRGGR